jgi:ATP-dependent DNA helicase RecG
MIDKNELQLILKEGEGYRVEFKEIPSNLDKEMVAFANASGGRIFIGVTDSGEIKGIDVTNRLKSQIQDIANNCRPQIQIIFQTIDNVLVIEVREGENKPYECSSGFYKRVGPNCQKITRNEILEYFKTEGKIRFDELIVPKFKYPKDFDRSKLNRFLDLASLSKSAKAEIMLLSLGVCEKQEGTLYFNNSGVLFYGREPQKFIPWSVFTVVLFKDTSGVDVIDRKEVTGSLFDIVEQVIDFVKLYSKVAYKFTGNPQREELYEYPFEAIREAVINSVMHKDYFEHGHNNILKFFPDRLQIENIWVKPKNFVSGKTVFRRNPRIAELFSRIHFGEKIGSGMGRMKMYCKNEGAPYPKIEFTDTHYYIVFRPNTRYLELAGKEQKVINKSDHGAVEKTVEITVEKILALIKDNPKITQRELMDKTGLSRRGIEWNLKKLKEEGLLSRIGPDKGGHWELINRNKGS